MVPMLMIIAAALSPLLLSLTKLVEAAPSSPTRNVERAEGGEGGGHTEHESLAETSGTGTIGDEMSAADNKSGDEKVGREQHLDRVVGAAAGSVLGRAPSAPSSSTPVVPKEQEKEPETTETRQRQGMVFSQEDKDRQERLEMDDFMDWCKQVMGIETSLEISYFDYPVEFLRGWEMSADYLDLGYDEDDSLSTEHPEMVKVRGLAATRDIEVDEIIISIPLNAMVTIKTTIDHDPVLSRVLGPESRANYGWDDGDNAADYEIPILIVAILYHRSLGRRSPLASYMHVLESTPVDSMPFMWDKRRLRTEAGEGVRKAVRDVRADIRDMYDAVIKVLVRDYPDVFGRKSDNATNGNAAEDNWIYSHKSFQWAFAMVNSRHWHVPVVDLDSKASRKKQRRTMDIDGSDRPPTKVLSSIANEMPPAEQPTDEYVQEQEGMKSSALVAHPALDGVALEDEDAAGASGVDVEEDAWQTPHGIRRHSFLAPLADLLNFGPPCTRGIYDPLTHRFNIVATCKFRPGQEVTFYYSDDCSDIMFANYGFVHPMVPMCPTAEEYRTRSDAWRDYADKLEGVLEETYQDVDRLEGEVRELYARIRACDGCSGSPIPGGAADVTAGAAEKKPLPTTQKERERAQQELERSAPPAPPRRTLRTDHRNGDPDHVDGIRGGSGDGEVGDDRREPEGHGGVRRMWMRPKSDRGL